MSRLPVGKFAIHGQFSWRIEQMFLRDEGFHPSQLKGVRKDAERSLYDREINDSVDSRHESFRKSSPVD